jgi:hypothetical protein
MHTFGGVRFVHLPSHKHHKLFVQYVRCAFTVMVFLTKVMFATIHDLIDFIYLVVPDISAALKN